MLIRTGRAKREDMENAFEFPDVLHGLWDAFLRLNSARLPGMGFRPITEGEMLAYARNRGLRFNRWEADLIARLDCVARDAFIKSAPKPTAPTPPRPPQRRR